MSEVWSKLTPVAVVLGIAVDAVAVVAWLADGIAVVGDVKLHWPVFFLAGAILIGLAGPGLFRWWVAKQECRRQALLREMRQVITAIKQLQEGLAVKSVDQETIAKVFVAQEVNPKWFPEPIDPRLALMRAHKFRERLLRMPYRKAMRLIRSDLKSQPTLTKQHHKPSAR